MVPFAGFNMPVQYAGLKEEHHAVRDRVGMFDVSHMGEFFVSGPDALALVQWVSSNDASALFDGKVQYSCMPNGRGGIVDDLLVYRLAEDHYMLVVNASNRAKDWAWIQTQVADKGFDVTLEDASARHALIALQGPEAQGLLGQLSPTRKDGQPWEELTYYTFTEGELLGQDVLVSATGYTGAGGVEIYVAPEGVAAIWEALLDAGVPPCGLGARDTLRMEMGFCLYGNDIDDSTSPISAGLGWVTKFTKDFVDAETLKAHKADGTPLVIVAGKEYGTGSSRDWAAQGTNLLGVRAVITESFERIHRSNLVGMGVLPLQFAEGVTRETLKLTGDETFTIHGVASLRPRQDVEVTLARPDGTTETFMTRCRIDTVNELEYFLNGGILQYVLRKLAA